MVAVLKQSTETATADSASTPYGALFRCATSDLKRAAALLARISDRKSSIAILGYVLVRTDDEGTTLAATDLNLSVTIRAPWVGSYGAITVPAKAFADAIKGFAGTATDIARDSVLGASLKSGTAATRLNGLHERDYPKLPDAGKVERWYSVDASALASMLASVAFSVCKDETRFHLNGTLYECDGETARTVSTDGHRLTKVVSALPGVPTKGIIIPAKGASEIVRILGEGKRKGTCDMGLHGPHLFVRYQVAGIGAVTIATKLIDAQFPPYEQVIPKDNARLITVERKPLIDALKRASKICTETRGVRLTLADGALRLTADHPDTGDQTESLQADGNFTDKDTFAIGFSPKYLLETIGEIDCDHVTLAFAIGGKFPELTPILVRATDHAVSYPVAESPFLGVVMPMRI